MRASRRFLVFMRLRQAWLLAKSGTELEAVRCIAIALGFRDPVDWQ